MNGGPSFNKQWHDHGARVDVNLWSQFPLSAGHVCLVTSASETTLMRKWKLLCSVACCRLEVCWQVYSARSRWHVPLEPYQAWLGTSRPLATQACRGDVEPSEFLESLWLGSQQRWAHWANANKVRGWAARTSEAVLIREGVQKHAGATWAPDH